MGTAFFGLHVHSHRSLIPVHSHEHGCGVVSDLVAPTAGIITSWAFYFDHIRTQISQDLRSVGSGQVLTHLDNLHAGQHHGRSLSAEIRKILDISVSCNSGNYTSVVISTAEYDHASVMPFR